MLIKKIKDLNFRNKFNSLEKKNKVVQFLFINQLNTIELKKKNLLPLILKKRNSFKTKIVRRCIFTNRSRGSLRKFNISRVLIRDMLSYGFVPGYKKAV
jgi:small subunit ribosomal protein S14